MQVQFCRAQFNRGTPGNQNMWTRKLQLLSMCQPAKQQELHALTCRWCFFAARLAPHEQRISAASIELGPPANCHEP